MAVFMKRNRFPMETPPYIRLNYIIATGTQFINTLYKPNQDTKTIMDAQFDNYTSMREAPAYFYCYGNNLKYGVNDGATGNNLIYFNYYTDYITWDIPVGSRRTIIADKNKATIDGITKTMPYKNFQMDYDLYLFAWNYSGSPVQMTKGKIWSCKIYENDVEVRDYFPVRMRESGEIGLWDAVENKFYGSAGTGAFIAGEEIT